MKGWGGLGGSRTAPAAVAKCSRFDLELFLENVNFSPSPQLPSSLTGTPRNLQPELPGEGVRLLVQSEVSGQGQGDSLIVQVSRGGRCPIHPAGGEGMASSAWSSGDLIYLGKIDKQFHSDS